MFQRCIPAQKTFGTKLLKTTTRTDESLDRVDTSSLICTHRKKVAQSVSGVCVCVSV